MSAHGHWWFNCTNARNKKDTSVYRHVPPTPPGRLDPHSFAERDPVNAPSTVGCPVHPRTSHLWDTSRG